MYTAFFVVVIGFMAFGVVIYFHSLLYKHRTPSASGFSIPRGMISPLLKENWKIFLLDFVILLHV